MQIAVIGLGAMGSPIALNLLKEGQYTIRVFDLDMSKVESLKEKGALGFSSASEAVKTAQVILSSLPNDGIVKTVMAGEDGVIASCATGSVIVDLSSVSPGTAREMSALAAARNVGYMDAPVSGGVAGAEAGTLTIMTGGEKSHYEKVLPVLNIIGKKVHHIGPVGSGDAIKIVNNLLLGSHMAALAEALKLGKSCGLSIEQMYEIISESSGASYVLNAKMEKFILPENFDGGFAVDLQKKDLNLALATAQENGLTLEITEKARDAFGRASASGCGRNDISILTQI